MKHEIAFFVNVETRRDPQRVLDAIAVALAESVGPNGTYEGHADVDGGLNPFLISRKAS